MIDPKSPKRYKATPKEWAEIVDHFADDWCWVCSGSWDELHHLLARSHSGDDVTVNLVPVCRACHMRIEARESDARSQIRLALLPSHYAYLRHKLGEQVEGWIERNYPVADAPAPPRESRTPDEELTTTTNQELTTPNSPKVYSKSVRTTTDPASV